MRCWLSMRPMARTDAETADVVCRDAADDAVKDFAFEFAHEVALHAEQRGAEPLDVHDEGLGPVESGLHRLVHDRVGVGRLLGDALDRTLENLARAPSAPGGRRCGSGVGRHSGPCRRRRRKPRPWPPDPCVVAMLPVAIEVRPWAYASLYAADSRAHPFEIATRSRSTASGDGIDSRRCRAAALLAVRFMSSASCARRTRGDRRRRRCTGRAPDSRAGSRRTAAGPRGPADRRRVRGPPSPSPPRHRILRRGCATLSHKLDNASLTRSRRDPGPDGGRRRVTPSMTCTDATGWTCPRKVAPPLEDVVPTTRPLTCSNARGANAKLTRPARAVQ